MFLSSKTHKSYTVSYQKFALKQIQISGKECVKFNKNIQILYLEYTSFYYSGLINF